MENRKMEELLTVTKEGFAGLHGRFDSLHARFDAFGEGLLFVARKVLAESEVRELRRILEGATVEAKRSA